MRNPDLCQRLTDRAARDPEQAALLRPRVGAGALHDRVARWAGALRERGIAPDHRALVVAAPGERGLVAVLGALHAGCDVLIADPRAHPAAVDAALSLPVDVIAAPRARAATRLLSSQLRSARVIVAIDRPLPGIPIVDKLSGAPFDPAPAPRLGLVDDTGRLHTDWPMPDDLDETDTVAVCTWIDLIAVLQVGATAVVVEPAELARALGTRGLTAVRGTAGTVSAAVDALVAATRPVPEIRAVWLWGDRVPEAMRVEIDAVFPEATLAVPDGVGPIVADRPAWQVEAEAEARDDVRWAALVEARGQSVLAYDGPADPEALRSALEVDRAVAVGPLPLDDRGVDRGAVAFAVGGPRAGRPTRWASWRGVGLAAVVCIGWMAAMPLPGPVSDKTLTDPIAREELDRWVDLLGGVGIDVTPEWLAGVAKGSSDVTHGGRAVLMTPFAPFFRITQTQQGWGLFAYPDTHPYQLEIAVAREDEPFQVVFLNGDPEHQWAGELLHYRRVRAMYNPGRKPPSAYDGLVTWLADRLFAELPEVDKVRVRLYRLHTTLPGATPDPTVTPKFTKVRRREAS